MRLAVENSAAKSVGCLLPADLKSLNDFEINSAKPKLDCFVSAVQDSAGF